MQISMVIPVYNDYTHLSHCLRSIQAAYPQPHEVIVIDDGSTQDMSIITKEFPFAQVIRQESRMGPGYARYIGVRTSKGDVIAFLDSDCYIKPDWFEVIRTHLHKDIGGIIGNYIPCNTDNLVAFYEAMDTFTCYAIKEKNSIIAAKVVIGGCCAFWKHVLLDTNFKPSFAFGKVAAGEDTLLGLEVRKKYKLLPVEAMKVYHHFHETWRQYFRKRFIDGWSHTVIFFLYKCDLTNPAYLKYPYIVLQLIATTILVYGLTRGVYSIIWFVFFALLYSEISPFRIVLSLRKVNWKKKLGFVFMRPLCILIRNTCWLAGVTSGMVYYLINYDRLLRLTIPAESDIPA